MEKAKPKERRSGFRRLWAMLTTTTEEAPSERRAKQPQPKREMRTRDESEPCSEERSRHSKHDSGPTSRSVDRSRAERRERRAEKSDIDKSQEPIRNEKKSEERKSDRERAEKEKAAKEKAIEKQKNDEFDRTIFEGKRGAKPALANTKKRATKLKWKQNAQTETAAESSADDLKGKPGKSDGNDEKDKDDDSPPKAEAKVKQAEKTKDEEKQDEKQKNDEFDRTVFEKKRGAKPALANMKRTKLRWKQPPHGETDLKVDKTEDKDDDSQQKAKPKPKRTEKTKDDDKKTDEFERTVFEKKEGAKPALANMKKKATKLKWKQPTGVTAESQIDDDKAKTKTDKSEKPDNDKDERKVSADTPPKKKEENAEPKLELKVSRVVARMDAVKEDVKPEVADSEKAKERKKNYRLAKNVMSEARRANILESSLSFQQNVIIKAFFRRGFMNPTREIVEILNKAIGLCWIQMVYHSDLYDIWLDNETRIFLCDREKAKMGMLDVLLSSPNHVPLRWGGRRVSLITAPTISSPKKDRETEAEKQGTTAAMNDSPWTRLLREVFHNPSNSADTKGLSDSMRRMVKNAAPAKENSPPVAAEPPTPIIAPPPVTKMSPAFEQKTQMIELNDACGSTKTPQLALLGAAAVSPVGQSPKKVENQKQSKVVARPVVKSAYL